MSPGRGSAVPLMVLVLAGTTTAAEGPVADTVVLRDGARVLGEVTSRSGQAVDLLVRREWARAHVPDWARRWEEIERRTTADAIAQRRARLTAWRRDRRAGPAAPNQKVTADPIDGWIDAELETLRPGVDRRPSTLLSVHPLPTDVRSVERAPRGRVGLLREAWLVGLRDPESADVESLTAGLEARGLDVSRAGASSVDSLLPPRRETEAVWLNRRAATEVLYDQGLRFVRYQGLLLPDASGGQEVPGIQALPALGGLLGGAQADPLPEQLRRLGARGKSGAMVTRLDMAADFSRVDVEMTLWVRHAGGRWAAAGSRSARVRPDDLGPEAGKDLADDPQIATAFQLVEALGLRELGADMKRRTLAVGAATRKALGQARALALSDLNALAFPVREHRGRPAQSPPGGLPVGAEKSR